MHSNICRACAIAAVMFRCDVCVYVCECVCVHVACVYVCARECLLYMCLCMSVQVCLRTYVYICEYV